MVIFFMGFLSAACIDNFVWFLRQLCTHCTIPPKFVCVDQDFACISAIERVLPQSLVLLDDWHLNQNQMKNLLALPSKLSHAIDIKAASQDLFVLRQSSMPEKFFERRLRFEQDCLRSFNGQGVGVGDKTIPRWFYTLCYSHKDLVVECFNRSKGGYRFLFQGTQTTESCNSVFHNVIVTQKTRLSQVSEVLLTDSVERHARHKHEKKTVSKQSLSLPRTVRIHGKSQFVLEYTAYCVRKYMSLSFDVSTQRTVTSHEACFDRIDGENVPILRFRVMNRTLIHLSRTVSVHVARTSETCPDNTLRAFCQCKFWASAGFPCAHITRAMIFFDEIRGWQPAWWHHMRLHEPLPLSLPTQVHSYWRRDSTLWRRDMPFCRAQPQEEDRGHAQDLFPSAETIRFESVRRMFESSTLSIFRQFQTLVTQQGEDGLRALEDVMKEALLRFRNSGPDESNTYNELNCMSDIRNPNTGNPKRRGRTSRYKSFLERKSEL